MSPEEIDKLFQEQIQIKGIEKKSSVKISKQVMYNYRHRPTLSIGDKIDFLININAITVNRNEPTPE